MRQWFIDKVAGPLVAKMFDSGVYLRLAAMEADARRFVVERNQALAELQTHGKQLLALRTTMGDLEKELLKYRSIANQAQMELLKTPPECEAPTIDDQIWWTEIHHPDAVPPSISKPLAWECDHLPADEQ